jgi:hypothetical protein
VLVEGHDRPHEDVDAVGIFNIFHTSSNTGLSDVTREAVISTSICFSLKSAEAIGIKEGKVGGAQSGTIILKL